MINRISSVCSFTADKRIIDSHVHLGTWKNDYYYPDRLKQYTGTTQSGQNVEKFFASTLDCLVKRDGKYIKNETEGNLDMVNNIKRYNAQDYVKPLLVCQPDSGAASNIEQLIKSHNLFYGLKFHPIDAKLNADSELYNPYMKLAEKYSLTTVFHSGPLGTEASPQKIYNLAKKFPKVPVVLYHMSLSPGGSVGNLTEEEIARRGLSNDRGKWVWEVREKWNQDGIDAVKESIAKKDANLYLETSWTKPETIVKAIKEVGADRVLFGTDAPIGDFGEFANKGKYYEYVDSIQNAIRTEFKEKADEVIEKVFYKNAENLFNPQTFPVNTNTISRTKPGKIIGIAAGIVGAGVGLFALNKQVKNQKALKNTQVPIQQLYKFNAFA
ncbi:amidohydrolase family protein [bacterium]|nr:amidohydrolase family protein [bacterium]